MGTGFVMVIGIFFWPLALAWAIVYGILGGFFYKLMGSVQELNCSIVADIRQWKRFPKRHYKKYIYWRSQLDQAHRKTSAFDPPRSVEQLQKDYTDDPFPWAAIIVNWWLSFAVIPIRCLSGMAQGPFVVLDDALFFWQKHILKVPAFGKYKKMLEIERDYKKNWRLFAKEVTTKYEWDIKVALVMRGIIDAR